MCSTVKAGAVYNELLRRTWIWPLKGFARRGGTSDALAKRSQQGIGIPIGDARPWKFGMLEPWHRAWIDQPVAAR